MLSFYVYEELKEDETVSGGNVLINSGTCLLFIYNRVYLIYHKSIIIALSV